MSGNESTVEIAPRIGARSIISEPHKAEHLGARAAGTTPGFETSMAMPMPMPKANDAELMGSSKPAIDKAKTFLSISNEYWLIGIIIVLITVILMLIVYVVKLKQGLPKTEPNPAQPPDDPAHGAVQPPMPHPHAVSAAEIAQINAQMRRGFVPRTGQAASRHGPTIEPVEEESDAQPEQPAESRSAADSDTSLRQAASAVPTDSDMLFTMRGDAEAATVAAPEAQAQAQVQAQAPAAQSAPALSSGGAKPVPRRKRTTLQPVTAAPTAPIGGGQDSAAQPK